MSNTHRLSTEIQAMPTTNISNNKLTGKSLVLLGMSERALNFYFCESCQFLECKRWLQFYLIRLPRNGYLLTKRKYTYSYILQDERAWCLNVSNAINQGPTKCRKNARHRRYNEIIRGRGVVAQGKSRL